MPSQTTYEKTLDELAQMLRTKPMTAREIAEALKCCRPAAYQRLRALKKRGDVVYSLEATRPANKPGPKSLAYGVRSAVTT